MSSARREPIYTTAIGAGRALFGGVLRINRIVSGEQHLPSRGGAVLAITHFGYLDFALTEWMVWHHDRRRIRFMAMKGAFDKPVVGWLLRGMRHISVDMSAGRAAYSEAVSALSRGELLGVFPEAGVSASFTVRELKSGAARMAQEAGVPLIPIVVWGGHLLRTKGVKARWSEMRRATVMFDVGEPIHVSPESDAGAVTERLRQRLQESLDRVQRDYPLDGTGKWWQPAHRGGTAPTPEEAARTEAARQARKAAARNNQKDSTSR